jgi:hypothetical protein
MNGIYILFFYQTKFDVKVSAGTELKFYYFGF